MQDPSYYKRKGKIDWYHLSCLQQAAERRPTFQNDCDVLCWSWQVICPDVCKSRSSAHVGQLACRPISPWSIKSVLKSCKDFKCLLLVYTVMSSTWSCLWFVSRMHFPLQYSCEGWVELISEVYGFGKRTFPNSYSCSSWNHTGSWRSLDHNCMHFMQHTCVVLGQSKPEKNGCMVCNSALREELISKYGYMAYLIRHFTRFTSDTSDML